MDAKLMEERGAPLRAEGSPRGRSKLEELIEQVEREAAGAGPGALERLQARRAGYRLAQQVFALRLLRNRTQSDIASLTGLQQSEISRVESGATDPQASTLLRIASALGADIVLLPVELK
jgi:Helix-turn-helix.